MILPQFQVWSNHDFSQIYFIFCHCYCIKINTNFKEYLANKLVLERSFNHTTNSLWINGSSPSLNLITFAFIPYSVLSCFGFFLAHAIKIYVVANLFDSLIQKQTRVYTSKELLLHIVNLLLIASNMFHGICRERAGIDSRTFNITWKKKI